VEIPCSAADLELEIARDTYADDLGVEPRREVQAELPDISPNIP
jgi:hypothetical protein